MVLRPLAPLLFPHRPATRLLATSIERVRSLSPDPLHSVTVPAHTKAAV